jgi:hypothetical protein
MSQYQSIAISLDDSDHWKVPPSFKYDLSGKNLLKPNEICIESNTPTEIQVGPMGDYVVKGEYGSLLEESHDLPRKPNKISLPWSFSYSIIFAALCFGFSIGFSLGYYVSESDFFSKTSPRMQTEGDSILKSHDLKQKFILSEEAKKVFQFMNEFIFQDSPGMRMTKEESNVPLLGVFSFPSSTPKRPLIYLSGPDAYGLLLDTSTITPSISQYSNDFFLVTSGLDVQLNQAYCGVASVAAIINSLRFIKATDEDTGVDVPVDPNFESYPYATQTDIFNNCTRQTVISQTGGGPGIDGILTPPYGLNMDQVSKLLQCHLQTTKTFTWKLSVQYVDNTHQTVGKMKFDLKNALLDPNSRILVNYDRETLGQVGGGHWAPIGSYSDKQDAFLVLDVAKYKYPSAWIPSERLFDAMSTFDECGQWKFPNGQDILSQEERFAHTQADYASAKTKLECQSKLRGYIIISRFS